MINSLLKRTGVISITLYILSLAWMFLFMKNQGQNSGFAALFTLPALLSFTVMPGVFSGWYLYRYAKKRYGITPSVVNRITPLAILLSLLPYIPIAIMLMSGDPRDPKNDTTGGTAMLMTAAMFTIAAAVAFANGIGQPKE